jgi:hypothetical protein
MANYAKGLPIDTNLNPLQEFPAPYLSQTRYNTTNAATSSVISLQPNTTTVEVGSSGGQGAVIRWVPLTEIAGVGASASVIAAGTGINFDHYVPVNTYRRFVVPKETQGQMAGGQVGSVNGLYQRVAIINAGGASSVLVSEF